MKKSILITGSVLSAGVVATAIAVPVTLTSGGSGDSQPTNIVVADDKHVGEDINTISVNASSCLSDPSLGGIPGTYSGTASSSTLSVSSSCIVPYDNNGDSSRSGYSEIIADASFFFTFDSGVVADADQYDFVFKYGSGYSKSTNDPNSSSYMESGVMFSDSIVPGTQYAISFKLIDSVGNDESKDGNKYHT